MVVRCIVDWSGSDLLAGWLLLLLLLFVVNITCCGVVIAALLSCIRCCCAEQCHRQRDASTGETFVASQLQHERRHTTSAHSAHHTGTGSWVKGDKVVCCLLVVNHTDKGKSTQTRMPNNQPGIVDFLVRVSFFVLRWCCCGVVCLVCQ